MQEKKQIGKKSVGYKVHFIYDNLEGDIKIIEHIRGKECKLKIRYENKTFIISTAGLKNCHLKEVLELINHDYNYKVGDIIETKVSKIEIIDCFRRYDKKKHAKKCYRYKCLMCPNKDEILEDDLKRGNGCGVCGGGNKVIKGYNDIATTAPWIVELLKDKNDAYIHSKSSAVKVWMKCPVCGFEKNIAPSTVLQNGLMCRVCSNEKSYPEKFIFKFLQQLNICFETEYPPEWCVFRDYKNKHKFVKGRYDFYFKFNNKEYIVEADGKQHKEEPKKNSKFRKTLKEQKYIDDEKDRLAIEHGIENSIRINCEKSNCNFIKNNILESMLNELFDLNNIDWVKCHEFACAPIVKEIYILWKNGFKTKDIMNQVNLSKSTVWKYLKQGNYFGIIKYDPKKEKKDGYERLKNKISKQIMCIETGRVFKSITECEIKSLEVFGVKLDSSMISSVCNGRYKHHKGYNFKFI